MADYKLLENGVLYKPENLSIPKDARNKEWRIYLKWLNAGNAPDPEYTQSEQDDIDAENLRVSEINAEQSGGGLKNVTVSQAKSYIDSQIDGASSISEVKTAIKSILKKMVVHIIR